MADSAILQPDLVMTPDNMFIQKPILGDSVNTFKPNALVTNAAGVLVLVATAGVLVYGQTPDISHLATEIMPQALFGENHYVFDISGGVIEINIGHANGTDVYVGAAGPAKQRSDVVIGGVYGILTPTTGLYAGTQFLDPTNTVTTLFTVVGFVDNTLAVDYNCRVRVKSIASKVQP